jgi:Tfp pilus assembly protein PilX
MDAATKTMRKFAPRRSEAGVALLIAMFAVLLVSLAAISLILSAGTESALAGNYRSSASAYYAASAGLEEARGRLLPRILISSTTLSPISSPPPALPSLLWVRSATSQTPLRRRMS